MGDRTKIEWSDATINPITGCRKASTGCRGCYAERLAATRLVHTERYKGLATMTPSGPRWTGEVRFNPEDLHKAIGWRRARKIFVCDMADLFYDGVTDEQIDQVFGTMAACRYLGREGAHGHTFQILTKRSKRLLSYLSEDRRDRWARWAVYYGGGVDPDGLHDQIRFGPEVLPNVWLGVSIENQAEAHRAIDLVQTPAAVRFISAEPLLSALDLTKVVHPLFEPKHPLDPAISFNVLTGLVAGPDEYMFPGIDWLIAGGESGPTARAPHPDWFRTLRDQCEMTDTAFFFKQWGSWQLGSGDPRIRKPKDRIVLTDGTTVIHPDDATREHRRDWSDYRPAMMSFVGKKLAGRELDGRIHDEFPEVKS